MGRMVTRRDMLKLAGGSALGLFFTPAPWKLVGDSALWTQNRPAIAKLPRGEITFRQSACTLCPLGCGVTARCVAGQPVSLAGVPGDPVSGGVLCPAGLCGHQIPFHPTRVRGPARRQGGVWSSISAEAAIALAAGALAGRSANELTVILDDRPGRARSRVYRAFAEAVPGGVYVPSPGREERPFERLGAQFETTLPGPLGFDLREARTILSFGAPLMDGFAGPGTAAALLRGRRTTGAPRIISAEPDLSRTASLADRWLAIRPGTEAFLALGIAHVLLRDRLVDPNTLRTRALDFENGGADYRTLAERHTPAAVAALTGLDPRDIEAAAHELAGGPALVLGFDAAPGPRSREEETIVRGLNLLLAARPGPGVLAVRHDAPATPDAGPSRELEEIPDGSIRLLILDGSDLGGTLPWAALSPKLVPGKSLVVSLSPWCLGLSRYADLIVPAPAGAESFQDVTGPPFTSTYRLAPPFSVPPADSVEPVECIRHLASALGVDLTGDAGSAAPIDLLKRRVALLHAGGRGRIVRLPGGDGTPVTDIASPDAMWDALATGGLWIDDSRTPLPGRFRLLGSSPEAVEQFLRRQEAARLDGNALAAAPAAWSGSRGLRAAAPLLTKLDQESGLRSASPDVLISPRTARSRGLAGGMTVRVETEQGSFTGRLRTVPGFRPDVVEVALGPDRDDPFENPAGGPADLFDAAGFACRVTSARIRKGA